MIKNFLIIIIFFNSIFASTFTPNHNKFIEAVKSNHIKQIKKLVDIHTYKDGNYLNDYATFTLVKKRKIDIELFEYIEKKGNFNINSRVRDSAHTILHSAISYYYIDKEFIKYLIDRKDVDKSIRSSFYDIFDYFNYHTIMFRYRTNDLSKHSFLKYWNSSWNTPLQDAKVMLEVVKKRKQRGDKDSTAYLYDWCCLEKRVRKIDDDISDLEDIIRWLEESTK